jgi:hypothetical protein
MNVASLLQDGLTIGRPPVVDAPAPDGFVRCVSCHELAQRRTSAQITCGRKACQSRVQYHRSRRSEAFREANKRRCAAWYQANREAHIAKVVARSRRTYGGATGPWFATPHAVQRWREYFDPRVRSYEKALGNLLRECHGARFIRVLDTGAQLWRGPRPRRARFIVSLTSEGELPALVTVLPSFDGWVSR